jgi:hypothetical protein
VFGVVRYGDRFVIRERGSAGARLSDRRSPRIVVGDWHNLRRLIRIADLDYSE